jgi:hypothetical protein
MKIISGAQTGADLAGLDAAKALGIPTGGSMPNGFKDLEGKKPEYASKYGIVALKSASYPARTLKNVQDADATLILATNANSAGTKLTIKYCNQMNKPCLILDPRIKMHGSHAEYMVKWLQQYDVINIAGNSEKSSPGIYHHCYEMLKSLFASVIGEAGN